AALLSAIPAGQSPVRAGPRACRAQPVRGFRSGNTAADRAAAYRTSAGRVPRRLSRGARPRLGRRASPRLPRREQRRGRPRPPPAEGALLMKSPILASVLAGIACTGAAIIPLAPAHAQFGGVVFDPSNYAQNVLTAARTLQQINNQI